MSVKVVLAQDADQSEELVDLAQVQDRAVVELDEARALTVERGHDFDVFPQAETEILPKMIDQENSKDALIFPNHRGIYS